MIKLNSIVFILCCLTNIIIIISCSDLTKEKSLNSINLLQKQTAHISPEIIDELKDFKNLIPTSTVDAIVAKHYLVDGSFRTALQYLRSQEFTQLQKELLKVPEIIIILEFLHLTTTNATTSHMGVTKMPAIASNMASLEEYFADFVVVDSYNRNDKMTTNTDTASHSSSSSSYKPTAPAFENEKKLLNNLKVPIRPTQQHFYIKKDNSNHNENNKYVGVKYEVNEAANANSVVLNDQPSLLLIVLLKNLEVMAKGQHNKHQHHQQQRHKYNCQSNNCYQHHSSLGTFTTFVEEILQHLPNADYQNMIREKCRKNLKFAEFYQALRSADFKPLIEQIKSTNNIKNIIQTLNSHNVDVNALERIAFQVISWGPNI